jgi:hypothetical protein
MSVTLRRTVQPKIIDANKNETNLDSYTVDSECSDIVSKELIIAAADTVPKSMLLPVTKTYSMELISDQPVDLEVTYYIDDCGATATIPLKVMNYMVVSGANTPLCFGISAVTVANTSGYDATLTWRATGIDV